jgi:hypothetical protein
MKLIAAIGWPLTKVDRNETSLGGDSQNFLRKFVRFFVTLGHEILRLFWLKALFEVDIIKG